MRIRMSFILFHHVFMLNFNCHSYNTRTHKHIPSFSSRSSFKFQVSPIVLHVYLYTKHLFFLSTTQYPFHLHFRAHFRSYLVPGISYLISIIFTSQPFHFRSHCRIYTPQLQIQLTGENNEKAKYGGKTVKSKPNPAPACPSANTIAHLKSDKKVSQVQLEGVQVHLRIQ